MKGPVTPEAAAAVAAILNAGDHYSAIDAPRSASTADLRRCFLRASVLVHPDKNRHPDATRAFQRVAAAWTVLSNETRRARYDAELREGREDEDEDQVQMTPEEAFAAFAFTAAAFAAGGMAAGGPAGAAGAMGDFAETLFWAQQLGQLGQFQQMHRQMQAHPHSDQAMPVSALAATAGGLALSAGMWTAGAAISLAGLGRIGSLTRRAALLQLLGQVAIASQNPSVRDAAVSGARSVSERAQEAAATAVSSIRQGDFSGLRDLAGDVSLSDISTRVNDLATSVGEGISHLRQHGLQRPSVNIPSSFSGFPNMQGPAPAFPKFSDLGESFRGFQAAVKTGGGAAAAHFASMVGSSTERGRTTKGPWKVFSSMLGRSGEDSSDEDCREGEEWARTAAMRASGRSPEFRAGTCVRLTGLKVSHDLEGKFAEVVAFDKASSRYQVRLLPPREEVNSAAGSQSSERSRAELKLVRGQNMRLAVERSSQPPAAVHHFF